MARAKAAATGGNGGTVGSSSSAMLPVTSTEANVLVAECLGQWEQGGRQRITDAIHVAFAAATAAEAGPSSHRDAVLAGDGGAAFTAILHALLIRHVLRPQLIASAFSTLLLNVVPRAEEDQEQDEDEASRAPSPAAGDDESGTAQRQRRLLANAVVDVVWSVDDEIDAHRDLAAAYDMPVLAPFLAGDGTGTLEEQAASARRQLADVVRNLLTKNIVSRLLVSERLETPLLAAIGIVQDQSIFNKRAVQVRTSTHYKQQKFNLLREENEGYSALINELLGGMGPPITAIEDENGDARIVEQESTAARDARVARVMNNIKALIGYFDLDPNRVLDVLLDIFASNIVHRWPFFFALLRASLWGQEAMSEETSESEHGSSGTAEMDVDFDQTHLQFASEKLDISKDRGSKTIAQILGFKFGYYQMQDVRDNVPAELYLLAAMLIRQGYVRFAELYTHLSPDEKGMAALHEKYKKAVSDRASNVRGNALSMAAPLTDDAAPGASTLSDTKDASSGKAEEPLAKEPPNQIIGLLDALLAVGQLKHALFILGRYPWICSAYPHTADLYCRLLNHILQPAYEAVSLKVQHPILANVVGSKVRMRYDLKRKEMVPVQPPQWKLTSRAPEPLATGSVKFAYFFAPWRSLLPQCQAGNVLQDFVPLLRILGINLWRSPTLFQKLCRLGKVAVRTAMIRNEDRSGWLEVVRNFLLPTLSMTSGNSGLVSEVWVILRHLPFTERYGLYGEWKHSLYRRPELKVRQAETEKEAKDILKRISSDNVKLSGRSLAKASHANPTIFFTVALNQVQSYSNLIAPIVECAKYVTHFEYDVFGFNLIDALSNPEKERTKSDGTSVSLWLQSLAAFTGTLYRRYALMDCSAVLQYVANQLKENNLKDLVLVRELVLKMAGIEPLANLSDGQVAALSGGRLLHMEAMMVANAGIASQSRAQLRRSGARLLQALTQSRMLLPLLILIAQQRQACVHLVPESEAHLKYLGNLFDTSQEILFQYVEFLHNQLEPQAYADLVPSLEDMCRRFEIEPAIAFHIVRPRLGLRMRAVEARAESERLRKELMASKANGVSKAAKNDVDGDGNAETANEGANGKVKMEEDGATPSKADAAKDEGQDVEMKEEITHAAEEKVLDAEDDASADVKEALMEATKAANVILPEKVHDVLGVKFYATFWQMGLSDINVPLDRYEQELKSLKRIIDEHPDVRKIVSKPRAQATDLTNQLRAELKEQTLVHNAAQKRLAAESGLWFSDICNRNEIVYQLIQYCLVPRALLSPTDAIFAGRFLRQMHALGTRNFAALTAYDKIFMEVVGPTTFSSTENEARNFARFLQTILGELSAWFKDEARYNAEIIGDNLPGFQMRWAGRHGGESIPETDVLKHSAYKTVIDKWHTMLRSTFRECLLSREYMRTRNSIVIMTRIASAFPMWETHGNDLLECVKTVADEEERGDLKILGQGLLATLRKEQKSWIPSSTTLKKAATSEQTAEAKKKAEPEKKADTAEADDGKVKELELAKDNVSAPSTRPSPISRSSSSHALPARPRNGLHSQSSLKKETPSGEANHGKSTPVALAAKADTNDADRVAAARRAALASMKEGSMNPPRAPTAPKEQQSSTSSRHPEDKYLSTQSADTTAKEASGPNTPRSQSSRSRNASPSLVINDQSRNNVRRTDDRNRPSRELSEAKRGDRVGREDSQARTTIERRRDGDAQSLRERRESERDDRSRQPERTRERDRGGDRPRARESEYQNSRDARYDRGYERQNSAREEQSRPPRTEHSAGAHDRDNRISSKYVQDGRDIKQDDERSMSRQNISRQAQRSVDARSGERAPRQPESDARRDDLRFTERDGTRTPSISAQRESSSTTQPSTPTSPGGSSKKRSLADRLAMSQNATSAYDEARDTSTGPSSQRDHGGQEGLRDDSNKRARTSRGGRESDSRTSRGGRESDSYREDGQQYNNDSLRRSNTSSEMGISIQGQGRTIDSSSQVGYEERRDERNRRSSRDLLPLRASDSAYSASPSAAPRDQRHASSGSGRSERRGGRDKDQRRRERRSGA